MKQRFNKRRRLLVVWTVRSGAALLLIATLAVATRKTDDSAVLPGDQVAGLTSMLSRQAAAGETPIRFRDVTTESGIAFRHFPQERSSLLPEDMGSGVALADFDGDGLTDIFLVNFAGSIIRPAPKDNPDARCRLYRNVGDMRFVDVTDASGLGLVGFAMGASWGDYDNDGDLDLYITALGDNALFRNHGDGTFSDVTKSAGAQDPRFSTGCTWGDYNRDGHLDLYVSNYVHFVFRDADRGVASRQYGAEQPYTLNPSAYAPQPNALFKNNGDGTFENVAEIAGVADPSGRSLAASWVDMDNDGWIDLYIANDVSNNGVFRNRGDGTFEDIGPSSLAADYRGAMGIAVSDFDDDLDQDLLLTHWLAQENALFRNMFIDPMFEARTATRLWYLDNADAVGLGQVSLDMVGWATGFADFDNDGRRDLWIVNGSTFEQTENHRLLIPQRPLVFWHRTLDEFIDVAALACDRLGEPMVGRGGAQADFDRDGRVDLVIQVHGGTPILLKNISQPAGHWLGVRLRQPDANRFGVGAKVYVTAGGRVRMSELGSSPSYLSQNELTAHFGLGPHRAVESVRVVWPDGTEQTQGPTDADQIITLVRKARSEL